MIFLFLFGSRNSVVWIEATSNYIVDSVVDFDWKSNEEYE